MKHFLYDTAIGQVDGLCNNLRVTILNGAKPQRLWRQPCIHTAGTSVRDGEAGSEPVAASRNLDDVGFDNKQVACCAHDRASYGNCAGAFAEGGAGNGEAGDSSLRGCGVEGERHHCHREMFHRLPPLSCRRAPQGCPRTHAFFRTRLHISGIFSLFF